MSLELKESIVLNNSSFLSNQSLDTGVNFWCSIRIYTIAKVHGHSQKHLRVQNFAVELLWSRSGPQIRNETIALLFEIIFEGVPLKIFDVSKISFIINWSYHCVALSFREKSANTFSYLVFSQNIL